MSASGVFAASSARTPRSRPCVMPGTASARLRRLELAWVGFVYLNVAAMWLWPRWETIPFHLIWLTMTLLYGFTVWSPRVTLAVLTRVAGITGVLILHD